jgi:peptidoglycan/LPS O-acetylase OafA/YrhL
LIGLTAVLSLLALFEAGVVAHDSTTDNVVANVFTWFMLLAFLGYGRQHLSFGNRLLSWARDASYPVYILHQTVIIVIAYPVIQQPWRPWTKYWVVLVATLVACVLLYEFLLRRWAPLRIAFGIKTHTNARVAPIGAAMPDRVSQG